MKTAEKKIDRRISRTRSALRRSLVQLIDEKKFEDITVEEIAARANVARATFYSHFRDKEDLLLAEISDLVNERVGVIANLPLAAWKIRDNLQDPQTPMAEPLRLMFQHIHRNANLYRLVLSGEGAPRLSQRVGEIIANGVNELLRARIDQDQGTITMEVPVGFLASFVSGALLGCANWWLDYNTELSPEAMAGYFQQMFFPGAQQVMSIADVPAN